MWFKNKKQFKRKKLTWRLFNTIEGEVEKDSQLLLARLLAGAHFGAETGEASGVQACCDAGGRRWGLAYARGRRLLAG